MIRQYLAGNSEAYDGIHRLYKDCLWRYLAHRTRNDEDTKELFNIVCYEVARLIGTLQEPAKLRAWVCRIAEFRLKNFYTKKHLEVEVPTGNEDLADPHLNPEDELSERQQLLALRQSILALEGPQRTVSMMFYLGQVPQKEISSELGIPLNTVKSHLRRAKMAIMERLAEKSNV